jgi:hypothetical protein
MRIREAQNSGSGTLRWIISFKVRLAAYLVHDIERGFEELLQGAFLGAAVAGRFPRGCGGLRGLHPFPLLQPSRLGRKVSRKTEKFIIFRPIFEPVFR